MTLHMIHHVKNIFLFQLKECIIFLKLSMLMFHTPHPLKSCDIHVHVRANKKFGDNYSFSTLR